MAFKVQTIVSFLVPREYLDFFSFFIFKMADVEQDGSDRRRGDCGVVVAERGEAGGSFSSWGVGGAEREASFCSLM